jgi:hypothetical protein
MAATAKHFRAEQLATQVRTVVAAKLEEVKCTEMDVVPGGAMIRALRSFSIQDIGEMVVKAQQDRKGAYEGAFGTSWDISRKSTGTLRITNAIGAVEHPQPLIQPLARQRLTKWGR